MALQEQRDNNSKIYFDDNFTQRIVDVVGYDVTKFVLEAGAPTDDSTGDPTQFTCTMTEGGGTTTLVNSATAGEKLLLTTAGNEYDGVNLQLKGEAFKLDSTKKLYFGCELKVSDATQSDLFIGLAETDTTLLNAASSHAIALGGDGVFFSCLDASTTIAAKVYLDGAETATANYGTALDTTATWFEIYWNGETVYFYVDNTLVTSVNSSLADGDMTVSYNYRAGASGADTSSILQLKCFQW